jgi:fatty-acid desaturase
MSIVFLLYNRVCIITLVSNVNWMVLSLAYYICFQMFVATDAVQDPIT